MFLKMQNDIKTLLFLSLQNTKVMKLLRLIIPALVLCTGAVSGQYDIRISMPVFAGDTLLFGHYFNQSIMVRDTFVLDAGGKGLIEGRESLPGGLYALFYPDKMRRLDLIVDQYQVFSFSTDTLQPAFNTKFEGSPENTIFFEYLAFIESERRKSEPLLKAIQQPVSAADSIRAQKEMKELQADIENYVGTLIESHKNLFLSTFLLAMKEVEVPEAPKDSEGKPADPFFGQKYYQQHYWDYFDLSDVRLLRTPFYEQKLKNYLENWVYPVPDSIYKAVDMLISASRTDTLLFKYMLTTVFNHYAKSKYIGMDAVYVYIAEKYFIPEASWSDPKFMSDLKARVASLNPLLIGKQAPDIELWSVPDDIFRLSATDSTVKKNPHTAQKFRLSEVKGKFILIYFWEAGCGHCKKSIPELYEIYQRMKPEGVEIVAVSLLGGVEGKVAWTDFVNEHHLYGWINAWNPYDFSYKEQFDVKSSNILYLLDGNRTILAKNISPEQAEQIIQEEIKRKKESP